MPANPKRITMALDLAGLYGPEVDAALGVEEPTVDRWESGDLVPTPAQLRRLALLCGRFTLEWFMRPDPPTMTGWMCGPDGCEAVSDAAE